MNNRFKFRAWDKGLEEMTTDDFFIEADDIGAYEGREPRDLILMQWTGLLDYYDKEIFEGDILGGEKPYCYVFYKEGGFRAEIIKSDESNETLRMILKNCPMLQIIGNIYENPKLLNKKTKPI